MERVNETSTRNVLFRELRGRSKLTESKTHGRRASKNTLLGTAIKMVLFLRAGGEGPAVCAYKFVKEPHV